jgi:hypothetical protein
MRSAHATQLTEGARHVQPTKCRPAAPQEILDIRDGEGLVVSCLRGVLWITQSEDTDDIIVRPGESFVLDRHGLAIVSAPAGPADLTVRAQSH